MGWRDESPWLYGVTDIDGLAAETVAEHDDLAEDVGLARISERDAMRLIEHLPQHAEQALYRAWVAWTARMGHSGAMTLHADILLQGLPCRPAGQPEMAAAIAWTLVAQFLRQTPGAAVAAALMAAKKRVEAQLGATPVAMLAEPPRHGIVVLPAAAGGKAKNEYSGISGIPLPLTPKPDLPAARKTLIAEFPHAAAAIEAVLGDMADSSRPEARTRPTLLLGSPGSGKSRLARRILETLGVPVSALSCGGVDDGRPMGTSKGWANGHGSIFAESFLRGLVANPGILLDEIDKVGSGNHNGSIHNALLGVIEPETATAWSDPYVGQIDVSHALVIATANTLALPPALRSRFRVLRVPSPTAAHAPALVRSVLAEIARQRGLDHRWLTIDGAEMEALAAQLGSHGSVRILSAQVERVLSLQGVHNA